MSRTLFLSLLILFTTACKKECESPAPNSIPKRISSLRVVDNLGETRELHFIYNSQNQISTMLRIIDNNQWLINYTYNLPYSIWIEGIGNENESQDFDSTGYPASINTSTNRTVSISYKSPGLIDTIKTYLQPGNQLHSQQTYQYKGEQLVGIEINYPTQGSYTDTLEYGNGKLVRYGNFYMSYSGNCLSRYTVSNSVDHIKEFYYSNNCQELDSLYESTTYPNGDFRSKSYTFSYEEGIGEFPFYWQTPFYRLTGLPGFLPHAWNYGGL